MAVPKHVEDKIMKQVLADIQPSKWVVLGKAAGASLLGGFLSLFFCGQFGISIGDWAFDFSHSLPMNMTPINCALMCGVVFSVIPVFLMKFVFFNTLQFKAAMQRSIQWVTLPYLLWLPVFLWRGSFSQLEMELALWALAAFVTTFLLGRMLRNTFQRSLYVKKGFS